MFFSEVLSDLSSMLKLSRMANSFGFSKSQLAGCKSKYFYKTKKAFSKRNKYKKFKKR